MEADAMEIRLRATRRIDDLRRGQKEVVGLNVGTRGNIASGGLSNNPPVDIRPTLTEQGIDKNLAHRP
jgi:hypothetical protein